MEFFGDYHTHSRYSDGRERIIDIVDAAVSRGLDEVAITDHGPRVLGSGVRNIDSYRHILEQVNALDKPRVRVLVGAEANILDEDGTLDIPAGLYQNLDVLICGLHPFTLPNDVANGLKLFGANYLRFLGKNIGRKAVENNTRAVIAALEKNPVDILAHPGLYFEVDIEEVARACIEYNVLFEINCGHHYPNANKLHIANRIGVNFIVNSDAHFYDSVGVLHYGSDLLKTLGVDKERVFNCKNGGGRRWIGKRKSLKH